MAGFMLCQACGVRGARIGARWCSSVCAEVLAGKDRDEWKARAEKAEADCRVAERVRDGVRDELDRTRVEVAFLSKHARGRPIADEDLHLLTPNRCRQVFGDVLGELLERDRQLEALRAESEALADSRVEVKRLQRELDEARALLDRIRATDAELLASMHLDDARSLLRLVLAAWDAEFLRHTVAASRSLAGVVGAIREEAAKWRS